MSRRRGSLVSVAQSGSEGNRCHGHGVSPAIDAAVSWSLVSDEQIRLNADYLRHDFRSLAVRRGSLAIYYGIGGRILLFEGRGTDRIGLRIPVGSSYTVPSRLIEFFVELVPVVGLAPRTDAALDGAIGARYLFR